MKARGLLRLASHYTYMKARRVRTYVPGLDEILYGGIPERNVVLLSGGPGNGKSILAKQFLYNGLTKDEGTTIVYATADDEV